MFEPKLALKILIGDKSPALWASNAKPEVMRFLRTRSKDLSSKDRKRLLDTILAGPSRSDFTEMSDEDWDGRRDYYIWVRLKKIEESGAKLPKYITNKISALERQYNFILEGNRSEEFSYFISSHWGPREDERSVVQDFDTMTTEQFIEWAASIKGEIWDCGDGWPDYCDKHPKKALVLLQAAGKEGSWPVHPWYTALSRFHQDKSQPQTLIRKIGGCLLDLPLNIMHETSTVAAWWLEQSWSKLQRSMLWALLEKMWHSVEQDAEDERLDYDGTLNHASGIIASILIAVMADYHPRVFVGKTYGMPKPLIPFFEAIGDGDTFAAKLGRIRCAASLLYLYRVDPQWTRTSLIDRMMPDTPKFESTLWEGYLWSPRMYDDLLSDLKPAWLQVMEQLDLVPESVHDNAIRLFIHVAIPDDQGVDAMEAKDVLYELETLHLAIAASALRGLLQASGKKAPNLWRNTIQPWFKIAWPRQQHAKSEDISEDLAWMAIEARDAFPEALNTIEQHLVPERWERALYHLQQSEEENGMVSRYPEASLKLANYLVDDQTRIAGSSLRKVLNAIAIAAPNLKRTKNFKRLSQILT